MPRVVLNVAEKPSVAREIANVLGGGRQQRRDGPERRFPIWSFEFDFPGMGAVEMRVTSVAGHLKEMEFTQAHRCDAA